MPILQQLVARESSRFAESKPRFEAAFLKERRLPSRRNFPGLGGLETARPCWRSVVIENPMNPDSAHFAHRAVGEDGRVFDRDVSLIVEAICYPTAQRFRREPAFIHGEVKGMFVVIGTYADRTQIGDERFPVPKLSGHKTISTNHF
jgi:hypothetical protein